MNDDTTLLLAFGIAQWQTALDHMEAVPDGIGGAPLMVLGRTERELDTLCARWAHSHGEVLYRRSDRERVVREARALCTERVAEIDELLKTRER